LAADMEPQPAETSPATEETRSHLKLLGVFYYLFGLMALPILAILFLQGQFLDFVSDQANGAEIEESFRQLFLTIQIGIGLMVIVHLVAGFYVGNCFRRQKHHTLCIVAAVFVCLSFPLGTVLGVFSLIVLMKPEAKALFGVPSFGR